MAPLGLQVPTGPTQLGSRQPPQSLEPVPLVNLSPRVNTSSGLFLCTDMTNSVSTKCISSGSTFKMVLSFTQELSSAALHSGQQLDRKETDQNLLSCGWG